MPLDPIYDDAVFRILRDRHGMTSAELDGLVTRHELDPALVRDLLQMALVTYEHLDVWGSKAEYARAVAERIAEAADEGGP